jgi:hypothetical protein
MKGYNMTDKVLLYKYGDKEFIMDPTDYPSLNLVGGELVDRNDPRVERYLSSQERVLEKERLAKFSEEATNFFNK